MSTSSPSPESAAAGALSGVSQAETVRFKWTRYAIFVGMAATYATYVFLRATFTYVSPVMASSLNMSFESIGKISSAFPIAYGMSRLVTGVIVDRTLPHVALAGGLFLAGAVNISMGAATSVAALAALWGLNGLVQGVGAGASAKMLTSWFNRKERGFFWALWSTSANVGGFLAPIICGWLATTSGGFRAGMMIPGGFAVIMALVTVVLMRSSPENAGLTAPWEDEKQGAKKVEAVTWKEALMEGVVKNKVIWSLAVSYFFVYLVRSGMKSWMHFWLLDARGCNAAEAAYRVSGMEIGGILGTFSAGVVSDAMDGRRVAVTISYLVLMIGALCATWALPGGMALADFAAISVVGFAINGPQMLVGLIGAEVCDKRVVATATGVLGLISYLGAAASGFPLSVVIKRFGWYGYFVTLLGSAVCSILFLAPLWKLRGETS